MIDVKFDSAKGRLATKEDVFSAKTDLTKEISRLETRMEQGFKDQLKWLIVFMLGFSSLIIVLVKLT